MRTDNRKARHSVPKITAPDGRTVSLRDLPLVAFRLNCGHYGRDYAVQVRDLVFCETCKTTKPVKELVA